jgi:hypothetical protein
MIDAFMCIINHLVTKDIYLACVSFILLFINLFKNIVEKNLICFFVVGVNPPVPEEKDPGNSSKEEIKVLTKIIFLK